MTTAMVLKCIFLRFICKEQSPVQLALGSIILQEKGLWQESHWALMKNSSQKLDDSLCLSRELSVCSLHLLIFLLHTFLSLQNDLFVLLSV